MLRRSACVTQEVKVEKDPGEQKQVRCRARSPVSLSQATHVMPSAPPLPPPPESAGAGSDHPGGHDGVQCRCGHLRVGGYPGWPALGAFLEIGEWTYGPLITCHPPVFYILADYA
jgi:hypothetical protein